MSRSERLFDLLHALRRHRRPVSGHVLAEQVGVSIRTLYRDIATLQAQGAEITGEPGVGYVLKPGFLLPPLMFSPEELEALVLGTRWVSERTDSQLADAARNALARIAAVLPPELRAELEQSALLVGASCTPTVETVAPALLRKAVRTERRLRIAYRDASGALSHRVVWPFAIAFLEQTRMVLAWCELRANFRSFRTDRIVEAELLEERYPKRGPALLKAWSRHALQTYGRTLLPEIDSM